MKKITVYFCGWGQRWPLGTLADNGQDLLFEYSHDAIARGIEFSPRHLKLQAQAFGDFPAYQFNLPGLIADALPDGWGLLLMDRVFNKCFDLSAYQISPLDRLAFIGDRAMGAFTFEPAALELPPSDLKLLEVAKEVESVVADRDTVALRQLMVIGGSPQGARPKALVQFDAETRFVSTREDAPGMPWLVKFPGKSEHKEVCAIEHCYAGLVRQCGLDMPATALFDLDPQHAAFGIARFDRQAGLRVPIHTLAGALHADFRVPSVSYQTLLRCTRAFTRSEYEVRKAFERCVFNVIFNNRDDHAKNFSFRMDETLSWKLAPCYDISYCEGPGGEHQMDIEGEGRNPGKPELMKLAQSNGLDRSWASSTIEKFATVAGEFKEQAQGHAIRPATRSRIVKAIEGNRKRMV
ncbi:MAG: type II toxin-antitoxin system HipA family toxin [Pseudomonadota bacterium]